MEFAEASGAAAAVAKNGEIEMEGRTLRLDASAGRSGGATPGRGGAANGATEGTTVFVKGFDTSGGCGGYSCRGCRVGDEGPTG